MLRRTSRVDLKGISEDRNVKELLNNAKILPSGHCEKKWPTGVATEKGFLILESDHKKLI